MKQHTSKVSPAIMMLTPSCLAPKKVLLSAKEGGDSPVKPDGTAEEDELDKLPMVQRKFPF